MDNEQWEVWGLKSDNSYMGLISRIDNRVRFYKIGGSEADDKWFDAEEFDRDFEFLFYDEQ